MSRVLLVAARAWRELLRQRAMIGMITALQLAVAGLACAALLLLQWIARDPALVAGFGAWLPPGVRGEGALQTLAGAVVALHGWLVFTQLLGIAGVLAGHTVLHDRQVNALPFLLLAPIRRLELLAGEVLGALGLPLALYALVSGGASLLAASLPVAAPYADRLPGAPAWWVAFLLGGPAWATLTSALCAVASGLARDVRTAQQAVWFVMFFATLVAGALLSALLPEGVGVQLGVALTGAVGAALALGVGAQLLSRDLSR